MNNDNYKDNDTLNFQKILLEHINNYFSIIKEENEIQDNNIEEFNSETIIKNNHDSKNNNFNDSKEFNNELLQIKDLDFKEKNKNTSNNNKKNKVYYNKKVNILINDDINKINEDSIIYQNKEFKKINRNIYIKKDNLKRIIYKCIITEKMKDIIN